jgi:putative restriction endonuclease
MKLYVGVTDNQWFDYLRRLSAGLAVPLSGGSPEPLDEVNFWQPGSGSTFKVLQPGEPFLFKLHSPQNFIVGGGFFAHWTRFPIRLAWEAFGIKNGARSFEEMRNLIIRRRGVDRNNREDFYIGCILLEQPFFFEESEWIPVPSDWKAPTQQGKHYDLNTEPGKSLWEQVQIRIANKQKVLQPGKRIEEEERRYGLPILITPRLGQGSFRFLVTDAYRRSCAITEEHSLPVLEAAHIKPFSEGGFHQVNNGLLLRSDVHRLFDSGYITVTPDYCIEVSRRLKEEFENGRYYYPFHGHNLHHLPLSPADHPSKELLIWHNENMFKG